jgi:DNA replication and repair protein RecF
MMTKLWIKNFRNLKEIVLEIKKFNLITGDNNQGKTSILEALYFISNSTSPLTKKIEELIHYQQEDAYIGIEFILHNQSKKILCRLTKDNKKSFQLDDQLLHRSSILGQYLNVRYTSADAIQTFTQNPQRRREAVDEWICISDIQFSKIFQKYQKILSHRNKMIKEKRSRSEFKIWNYQLIDLASLIVKKREEALSEIEFFISLYLKDIYPSFFDKLNLEYETSVFNRVQEFDYGKKLLEKLNDSYEKELILGFTLYGPHKDDMLVKLNHQLVSKFYSRGINRLIALLFELSLSLNTQRKRDIYPILLCDDAFVELSQSLKENLISLFNHHAQILYATVVDLDKNMSIISQLLEVKNGEVRCTS